MLASLLSLALQTPPEPSSRHQAAQILIQALRASPNDASHLMVAAESASQVLGQGRAAKDLEVYRTQARWRAMLEPEEASSQLASELEDAANDLVFQPLLEADLPLGFPAPTPVREIELKEYPRYRRVQAGMESERGAFRSLFSHIKKHEIAMTAPVELNYGTTDDGARPDTMAFLYGDPDRGRTGRDGKVDVVDVEPVRVVSIGCRGGASAQAVALARAELRAWLKECPDFSAAGAPRTLEYNSPMVPPDQRYFEVQIPVRSDDCAHPIADFSSEDAPRLWSVVNDGVMGGLSSSRILSSGEGSVIFEGSVSLENNGGFASVRARLSEGLGNTKALLLRVRGDGRTYKFRLRMSEAMDGTNYQVSFKTEANTWTEHRFEIENFEPVWRGRTVRDAPALDPARVRSLGILISDYQEGLFRLELASIRTLH